jgi:hypothetical protein
MNIINALIEARRKKITVRELKSFDTFFAEYFAKNVIFYQDKAFGKYRPITYMYFNTRDHKFYLSISYGYTDLVLNRSEMYALVNGYFENENNQITVSPDPKAAYASAMAATVKSMSHYLGYTSSQLRKSLYDMTDKAIDYTFRGCKVGSLKE